MASAFTHAIAASVLVPLAPAGVSRVRMAVGLAAVAVLPDADVIAFVLRIPYEAPLGHRGFSHSVLFAVLLGMLAARLIHGRAGPGFWRLACLYGLATISHGLLDALTDGGRGVGFWIPFDNGRYFLPWRPLRVSPIGVQAFLSGRGLAVLANEALWVWLPVSVWWLLAIAGRWLPVNKASQ